MAFRSWGRGRGRGGGFDHRPTNFTPYENYPDMEIPNLIDLLHASNDVKKNIAKKMVLLEDFWRGSCYHLQEDAFRIKNQSETRKIIGQKPKTHEKREALGNYLKLTPANFPVELIQGSRVVQQSNKKLKWDRNADQLALTLDKLVEKEKDKNGKGEMKQEEDEEEEEEPQAEEEESSDDDYNQNIDFDDDEDDMNMEEEADEDFYYD